MCMAQIQKLQEEGFCDEMYNNFISSFNPAAQRIWKSSKIWTPRSVDHEGSTWLQSMPCIPKHSYFNEISISGAITLLNKVRYNTSMTCWYWYNVVYLFKSVCSLGTQVFIKSILLWAEESHVPYQNCVSVWNWYHTGASKNIFLIKSIITVRAQGLHVPDQNE